MGAPALALAALGALALWPLLRAGYPGLGDGLNHYYRLVEFEHLLAQGVWFPRWATDFGYGYGYPLYNFAPSVTLYLGALFHAFSLDNGQSLLGVYLLGWLLAVTGACRLAREQGGPAAGLIAAAAYGLAPYLYFDALARGALPESLGLGLLPWVLWAFYRLCLRPNRWLVIGAAALYAALVLTHLLTALLALPLIVLFWLMARLGQPPAQAAPRQSGRAGWLSRALRTSVTNYQLPITLVLGFALSAYFLLPALLETKLVYVKLLTEPADLDYHNNFLLLSTLLSWPQTFDARLVFHSTAPSLSLAAVALALFGLAWRLWLRRRDKRALGQVPVGSKEADRLLDRGAGPSRGTPSEASGETRPDTPSIRTLTALGAWDAGLWLGAIGLSLMTLPLSAAVWDHLPGASLLQFPWRLVGPASLLLALLAARVLPAPSGGGAGGGGERPLPGPLWYGQVQIFFSPLALAALFFFSLSWTFYAGSPPPATAGVRDLAGYERDSGQLGATSAGEFLPLTVQTLPDPHSLDSAYALHSVIERLAASPAGVNVISQTASVTSAGAVITAQAPARLTFNIFDFAGWRASLDGRPVPITASQPNGLITVAVPAGQHTVEVSFGSTPLRTAATAVSLIAAGLLALIASGRIHLGASLSPTPPYSHTLTPTHLLTHTPARASSPTLFLTALLLLGLRLALVDGHETIFARTRFDGQHVASAGQAFDANFDDQLVLIGLDLPTRQVAADAVLPVTLYWRAQNVAPANDATTLQVLDDQGNVWGQTDSQNPGGLPTSHWTTAQYARDVHLLKLRPGTPPGPYRLVAGVYQAGGAALTLLDADRVPQGQTQPLGTLTVTRAQTPPVALGAAQPANIPFGPLTYLGGSVNPAEVQAGGDLTVELFWRAEGAQRPDLAMHLALDDPNGGLIAGWDLPPARADYPASAWAAGEIVRAVVRLRVPATALGGPAHLQLGLAGVPAPSPIALVTVRVPARSYDLPRMVHTLNAPVGSAVKLLGYDSDTNGVTLYWQAEAGMDTSYSVFVHALDAGGAILAQVDAPPLSGARPTTGWLPGEVLADRYSLPLGQAATLEVGLYDPATRQRLGTVSIPLR